MSEPNSKTTALTRNPTAKKWDLGEGEFCYVRDSVGVITYLVFWPWGGPCAIPAAISPHRNGSGATWTLSGTEDAPTLTPSVDARGIWHGFLTNGSAKSV